MNFSITSIPLTLLFAYYLGLPIRFLSGICLLIFAVLCYLKRERSERTVNFWLTLSPILFSPIFVFLVQLARLKNGAQGIDFAIFSQVVHSFSERGELATSLVDYKWHHFLTHHFSPYLYLLGHINKLANSAELVLLSFHAITVFFIGLLIYLIARELELARESAALVLILCILLPGPRTALLFEVRDEIYALPYLLAAYLSWLRAKDSKVILFLALAMLFKETMFIVAAGFSLMAILHAYFYEGRERYKNIILPYALFFAFNSACFLLYSKILPGLLFQPTFNGFMRIANFKELTDIGILFEKACWLLKSFAPFFPLLALGFYSLYKSRLSSLKFIFYLILLLFPAAVFIAAILLSNTAFMYQPYNYYSVLPVMLSLVALLIALQKNKIELRTGTLVICCLIACLIGPRTLLKKELRQAIKQESPILPLRKIIPETAVVLTGDFDATFFIRQNRTMRLFHANKNIVKFDYIVQRKTEPSYSIAAPLSLYLRSWSEVCYEDKTWLVRCAYPSARPKKG